ncbi:MAG: hypothetical protein J5797_05150 [Prevotella sp.]|nr:hypothetical protein [Prevotella sp.]
MNYEELVNSQESMAARREPMPFGFFYRKQIDRKYRYVVELRPDLTDSLFFGEGLHKDYQAVKEIDDARQLKYELHEDSGGIYEIELHTGSYLTLAQLLSSQPSIVAKKGFVSSTIEALMDITEQLHERGIYQLCYSPQMIFVRKGENKPMLLCHGSSFLNMKEQRLLYKDFENDVAPEVLDEAKADERSDVYALGRFIEHLHEFSEMGYEYKGVVKKATSEDPDKRYSTVHEMRSAISFKRNKRRSLWLMLGACAVVALIVAVFFGLIREPSTVEFIDDNGIKVNDHYRDAEYNPSLAMPNDDDPYAETNAYNTYYDIENAPFLDSIAPMTDEEVKMLSDSIKVNEQLNSIFRRRFEEKARTSLGSIYGAGQSGSSENDYIANSEKVMDELYDYAGELSQQTGLGIDDANSMASQIISKLQSEMQQSVRHSGVNTKPSE